MSESRSSGPTRVGSHRVVRWLRDTALAHVYHCVREEPRDGTELAVELHVLASDHHDDPEVGARFVREGRRLARLRHRGLPRVLEISTAEGVPHAVHELVEGPTLHQLQTEKGWGRSLDLRMVARIGLDVADALAHAWLATDDRGHPLAIVHGGLSLDRVILTREGFAHLIDLGTPAGPRYHAPEVLGGAAPSPRADVFALGVVLYALVTGQHAWPGRDVDPLRTGRLTPPRAVRDDVPDDLDALVRACLETRPSSRPRDAAVLADELSRWLQDHGGPVSDEELSAWSVEDAPSDGPRLVGTRTHGSPGRRIVAPRRPPDPVEGPTWRRPAALSESPTMPARPTAVVEDEPEPGAEAITVPHPGAIAERLAILREAERRPLSPVLAAAVLGVVALVGGIAMTWLGPAVGLPALDLIELID